MKRPLHAPQAQELPRLPLWPHPASRRALFGELVCGQCTIAEWPMIVGVSSVTFCVYHAHLCHAGVEFDRPLSAVNSKRIGLT